MELIDSINFSISNKINYTYNTTVFINHKNQNTNLSRHLKKIINISAEYDKLIHDIQQIRQ